jgi:type VI secretion system secreted protein Hcp
MANAMFLKCTGAPGTCTESKHKEWIEIDSYSFGGNQQTSQAHGGGAGAGRVSFQDFHFTATAGKESTVMFGFMCSGKHIDEVELHEQKAGGDPFNFVEIKLQDCFMTGYSMSDSRGASEPQASYSINFAKAKFKYTGQTDKGAQGPSTESGWDAKENKKM